MSNFADGNNNESKDELLEKCIEAINETQNKIIEEDSMKKLIKETLNSINEKEIEIKGEKTDTKNKIRKNKISISFKNIEKKLSRKKNKDVIIRIMMFLVMVIFIFNGALKKAYANGYDLLHIDISKLENSSIQQNDNSDNKGNSENSGNQVTEEDITEKKFVGVSKEGEKYSYDAVKINDKLKKGDYSNDGEKIVFLTFDDGTSTTVTPQVLKVLDQYDVKATFFLMGQSIEEGRESKRACKRGIQFWTCYRKSFIFS